MVISRLKAAIATLALAFLSTPALAGPGDPVISFDKSIYTVGDTATFTYSGTPGDAVFLLIDKNVGPTTIPGIATFDLALGPQLNVAFLGIGGTGQISGNRSIKCNSVHFGGPTYVQVASYDPINPTSVKVSNMVALDIVKGDACNNCPRTPIQDPIFGLTPGGTAVYLHGIGNDFVFGPGAAWAQYQDGTARLQGEIFRTSNPNERFLLDVAFSRFSFAGSAAFPPMGSPKLELAPAAYWDQGGPIYPQNWHYYSAFSGLLIGLNDFAGGTISIDRMGPSFQVGFGANGKDTTFGGSCWMNVNVLTQPTSMTWAPTGGGDINIGIGECPPLGGPLCVVAAATDQWSPQTRFVPHAVVMFQLDGKFLFDGNGGTFTEFPDGTARLQGTLVSINDPAKRWVADILFSGLIPAGDPSNPPAGSPKLELLPTAYIWNGGPVDPATWRYYPELVGTFMGEGTYDGANLLVTRRGPAFQVGLGANNKNVQDGGSCWTYFDVIAQPTQGGPLQLKTDGDINVTFIPCN